VLLIESLIKNLLTYDSGAAMPETLLRFKQKFTGRKNFRQSRKDLMYLEENPYLCSGKDLKKMILFQNI
jgi:hypothetical protein